MNLAKILADLKSERERINKAITAITTLGSTNHRNTRTIDRASAPKGRRRLSATARARIAAAQRARWARAKAQQAQKKAV